MMESTFVLKLRVPACVRMGAKTLGREAFFEWAWREFGKRGLAGIHEGTMLSEEAAEAGLETDSWTVDAGEAPRDRDWISEQSVTEAELYFSSRKSALVALAALGEVVGLGLPAAPFEQPPQDWDAQWKASFRGISVPPCWRIVPPWSEEKAEAGTRVLRINPGAGFGTGTHETTQLCLEALTNVMPGIISRFGQGRRPPVLDFGSGSGILSVAAALLGSTVDGVEIDSLAIDNALENARLNQVETECRFLQYLPAERTEYDIVIGNILKPVLLEFADELTGRLAQGGVLILSGLVEKDVEPVLAAYRGRLQGRIKSEPEVNAKAEWRGIVFRVNDPYR